MNRKLNINLILSADENDPLRHKDPFMPLSLAILASVAPGHNYRFTDMLWEKHDFGNSADLAGISVRMSAEQTAFRLADEYRKRGIKVILGGPQVSSNPFESLEHADAVAVGEGEMLWPVILEDFMNDCLRDFYVCAPETFSANGYRIFQLDMLPGLDRLPVARRDLFRRKYTFDMIFASRGCAINCDFCSVPGLFGSGYRFRPEDEVISEISRLRRYFYLIDDTVFGRVSTYDYYLSLYTKMAKLKKIPYWIGQANLDAASNPKGREVIRKASDAGLIYLAMGMESVNMEVLKRSGSFPKMGISKDEDTISRMKEHIRFIQDQGILISGWFAIGYEGDDRETYRQ
ncbi:MAG: radical SAM protein, partial [Bacteroidetes bacterium]|nr:radical SAM protein [Bacteroidota bacterium]